MTRPASAGWLRRAAARVAHRLPIAGRLLRARGALRFQVASLEAALARDRELLARSRAEQVRLQLEAWRGEPWIETLEAARAEVAADPGTRPLYHQGYAAEERGYWLHVPRWVWLDHRERPIRRALDVGCCYGTLALYVRLATGAEVDLTDFNPTYLGAELVRRHGLRFALHNLELDELPWPEARYDAILFTEVLEHLNFHPRPALERLRRALAPGGRLYLTTPDAAQWGRITIYYESIDAMAEPAPGRPLRDTHIYQYREDELRRVVGEAGLAVERFARAPGALYAHFNLTLVAASGSAKG